MCCKMRKCTFQQLHSAKTQISLSQSLTIILAWHALVSSRRQWRIWTACADVQTHLSICWTHMMESTFSHLVAHELHMQKKKYNAQCLKRALMQFADNLGPDQKCVSDSVQCNLGIFCLLTYTTVSTDSESGQQRPRSACAYVQADQGLHCP